MTRSTVGSCLFVAITCAFISCSIATRAGAAAERPNIIMFLIDDQDVEQIGAFAGNAHTPHLDRMAREGLRFTQAYVSSTVCTPSRYSFLTGRYAGNSRSRSYLAECPDGAQGFPSFNMGLEDDNMNVGAVLAASGYATGFVGKYHVHGDKGHRAEDLERLGLKFVGKDAADTPEVSAAFRHNELVQREIIKARGFTWVKHVYWGNMSKPYSQHNPEWTLEAAVEFIERHRDGPFYLHYCTTLLHGPQKSWRGSMDHPEVCGLGMTGADPGVALSRRKLLDELARAGADQHDGYEGEAWIDANLGALMAKLSELGIDRNTLVVFAPDHGRGNKGSLYARNGNRVPMIMRWPDGIAAGAVCDELVQNIDMAPTFFDLARAEVPRAYRMDGRSLAPLFRTGRADGWRDHLYFEMGCARAVMTRDWKYIATRYTTDQIEAIRNVREVALLPRRMAPIMRMGIGVRGADHPGFWDADQLYDLRRDPMEMTNLAGIAEHRGRLEAMRQMLRARVEAMGRPFGEFVPGGNAAAPGQVGKEIATVKKLDIQGKKVIVPPELGGSGEQPKKRRRERQR